MRSNKPFAETLVTLLNLQGISYTELARRTERRGSWGSSSTISRLVSGTLAPSAEAMRQVAGALLTEPETFAEYRLLLARERLDPGLHGENLEAALATLAAMERGEALAAEEEEPDRLPAETHLRSDDEDLGESA